MGVDLERALDDEAYRESVAGLADPVAELLRRAGAYAERRLGPPEEVYSTYGEYLGCDSPVLREGIPLDPTLPFEAFSEFLKRGAFARTLVAKHPSTPNDTLLALAGDEVEAVQKAVVENRALSGEVLLRLCQSQFRQVRFNVMHHRRMTRQLYETLLRDRDPNVRGAALKRLKLDGPALAQLAEKDPSLGCTIAEQPDVDVNTLIALAGAKDRATREAVARNRRAPGEALERIANQELDHELLELVLLHPNTPRSWLQDQVVSSPKHRRTLARREDLSADAQMICAGDADEEVRLRLARVATDSEALRKLGSDPSSSVRLVVAQNRKTPVEVLRALRLQGGLIEEKAERTLALLGKV